MSTDQTNDTLQALRSILEAKSAQTATPAAPAQDEGEFNGIAFAQSNGFSGLRQGRIYQTVEVAQAVERVRKTGTPEAITTSPKGGVVIFLVNGVPAVQNAYIKSGR